MAKAYMFIDERGRNMTRVYHSNGELVKTIPTDPSQIRKPRQSLLYNAPPGPGIDRTGRGPSVPWWPKTENKD